jgi:hypothetical protein
MPSGPARRLTSFERDHSLNPFAKQPHALLLKLAGLDCEQVNLVVQT